MTRFFRWFTRAATSKKTASMTAESPTPMPIFTNFVFEGPVCSSEIGPEEIALLLGDGELVNVIDSEAVYEMVATPSVIPGVWELLGEPDELLHWLLVLLSDTEKP